MGVVNVCGTLGMLTSTPDGAKRATDAGIVSPLVLGIRQVIYLITKPLMNLVSIDPNQADAAKEAGAKEEWYTLPDGDTGGKGGGGDEANAPPGADLKRSKTKGSMKNLAE